MTMPSSPFRLLLLVVTMCCMAAAGRSLHAQSDSLSSGLSQSSQTSGFNGSFEGPADSVGSNLQQGVTDTTGSQVTPFVSSNAGGSISGYDRSRYIEPTGLVPGAGGGKGKLDPSEALFIADVAAYRPGGFGVGIVSSAPRLSASASGEPPATPTGEPDTQGDAGQEGVGKAVDPAYLPATAVDQADLELGASPQAPSVAASSTFASPPYSRPAYQYDDGQTPLLGRGNPEPGSQLPTGTTYQVASGGFPDSTRGEAALPSEEEAFGPPATLVRAAAPEGSPFKDVSGSNAYAVKAGVQPSLKISSAPDIGQSFDAYEHHLFMQRILAGASVSQAEWLRRADLRKYESGRQNTLDQSADSLVQLPSSSIEATAIR